MDLMLNIGASPASNFNIMSTLRTQAKAGLKAEFEPCWERITSVYTKKTFTGRTAFSLFGLMMGMVRLGPRHATQTAGGL